jgi:cellulose synthase (UDP-forming)
VFRDRSTTFGVRVVMAVSDHRVYRLVTAALGLALLLFVAHWARVPEWRDHPVLMTAMTLVLALAVASFLQSWAALPSMRRPEPPPPPSGLRVAMITTFVPGHESLEMLEATVQAMRRVRYPHDIWVLDEGDDDAVRALCARLQVHHFSRRGRPELNTAAGPLAERTKYGNVNAWLSTLPDDRYDVVCAFDPDHLPLPGFLERTLGYFADPGIAFVQAAQVYYNQPAGLVARGAAEETYAYYSTTLMSGYGAGYSVVVGCHNSHRMTALRAVGGFAAHDADDLVIALNYLSHGWQGVYVPETLAIGLTPTDWTTYFTQQRRWVRSVFDIKLRILPHLRGRLRPAVWWLGMAQGLSYITDFLLPLVGIGTLCAVLLSGEAAVLGRLVAWPTIVLLIALGGVDAFRQWFYLNPDRERGLHWRAGLLRQAKWPAIGLGLWDAFTGRRGVYEITAKTGVARRARTIFLPHLVLGALLAVSYLVALGRGPLPLSLHLWPIGGLAALAALLVSMRRPAPPAFDPAILREAYDLH